MQPALDRPDRDGVGHQQSLGAGLDREQAGKADTHGHGKANVMPMAAFRQFEINSIASLSN